MPGRCETPRHFYFNHICAPVITQYKLIIKIYLLYMVKYAQYNLNLLVRIYVILNINRCALLYHIFVDISSIFYIRTG